MLGSPVAGCTQCSSPVSTPQGDMGATGPIGAPGPKGEKGDLVSEGLLLCMSGVGDSGPSPKHAHQLEYTDPLVGARHRARSTLGIKSRLLTVGTEGPWTWPQRATVVLALATPPPSLDFCTPRLALELIISHIGHCILFYWESRCPPAPPFFPPPPLPACLMYFHCSTSL